jgi:signal transduction histidine kinase
MNNNKEIELKSVSAVWYALCLGENTDVRIEDIVVEDVMGYGTTTEERIFGIDGVRELINLGVEQRKHLSDFKYETSPVFLRIINNDNTAIVVDEIKLSYTNNGIFTHLGVRLSSVFKYVDSKWKVLHWHGSVGVESENDTWHQNEWKRENEKLQQKVDEQTKELKKSFEELKSTQSQLIQSEKMASLGELTAGIAHEIQNPLNFVNNFSEVNNELIDEMHEELDNGDIEEAKAISIDIKHNLEKITHHGKRADRIVKGMLQHSRSGGDKKEPTHINALADEYLRLAYHGLRAKDKTFNAELITDFDTSIKTINVVPQDIGRVILNLLTNAFYAVHQKKQTAKETYKPTVHVGTKKEKDTIEIKITDNGNGMPDKVKEKIFQPFFTTKPAGQGTGLGLSLSYDIITKGHGGNLTVSTKEGEGTTFCIILPIKENL